MANDQLAALTRLCDEKDAEIAGLYRDSLRLDWWIALGARDSDCWIELHDGEWMVIESTDGLNARKIGSGVDARAAIDEAMESGAGAQKGKE